jgi:DNA-binding transcriptional ArsR family regulator
MKQNWSSIFKGLSIPERFSIGELLFTHGSMNVTDIQNALKLRQTDTSRHLKVLLDRGCVKVEKDGKQRIYMLTNASEKILSNIL